MSYFTFNAGLIRKIPPVNELKRKRFCFRFRYDHDHVTHIPLGSTTSRSAPLHVHNALVYRGHAEECKSNRLTQQETHPTRDIIIVTK